MEACSHVFNTEVHGIPYQCTKCGVMYSDTLPKPMVYFHDPALAEAFAHKVQLDFMVVPELLAELAEVPDRVRVKIVDPEAIFLTGLLGESGRKLVLAGVEFYFTRPLAEKLIAKGIAKEVTCTSTSYEKYTESASGPPTKNLQVRHLQEKQGDQEDCQTPAEKGV